MLTNLKEFPFLDKFDKIEDSNNFKNSDGLDGCNCYWYHYQLVERCHHFLHPLIGVYKTMSRDLSPLLYGGNERRTSKMEWQR